MAAITKSLREAGDNVAVKKQKTLMERYRDSNRNELKCQPMVERWKSQPKE